MKTWLWAIVLGIALVASGRAEEPLEAAQETEAPAWVMRGGGSLGAGYYGYQEKLSSMDVDSDFDTAAFEMRLWAEGNFLGFSPSFRLRTGLAVGTETASVADMKQEQTTSVGAVLLDLGLGYRIDLGSVVTLVPSVGYTLDYVDFDRSDFEIDGVEVRILDLDGELLSSVGETFLGHGLTGRLTLELRATERIELHIWSAFTHLPDVTVDNDLGGSLSTEGYMVRGGVRALLWLTPRLGADVGLDTRIRLLDQSGVKVRSGRLGTAMFQFPDSETLAVTATVGVALRF